MFFQKKRACIKENLVTALEVPRDMALKETIVTLTGKSRVIIENYRSILKFSREEVIVSTYSGNLIITGKRLEIPWYTAEEMMVRGSIQSVCPRQ